MVTNSVDKKKKVVENHNSHLASHVRIIQQAGYRFVDFLPTGFIRSFTRSFSLNKFHLGCVHYEK